MIEQIYNIGKVIRDIEEEKDFVELWTKDTKPMDNVIIIDINEKSKKISKELVSFYEDIYKDSLIYQQGNGHVGAGIKIENYKEKDSDKIKNKKLKSSLEFMELNESYLDKIWENIEEEVNKDITQSYFIMITKNNQKPREIYSDKYENKIKQTYLISDQKLNKSVKKSKCHLCGLDKKTYDTAIYKCFTNDKEIYRNTERYNFSICEDCILNILNGRSYINESLKTNWIGSEVMFLPHEFSEEIKDIYDNTIDTENKMTKLLENIKESEEEVLNEISNTKCMTDIVFFLDPKSSSEWKIIYTIRDIMPSRLSKISKFISKYKRIDNYFCISKIISYLCYSDGKNDSKNKDRMRLLDIIFNGNKFSRNLFFYKVMKEYKLQYFTILSSKKLNNRKYVMKDIHEIYNFMCDCGCLEKPWKIINEEGNLMKYQNRDEFFEINKQFFDTDVKKAWFIMGQIYNTTIYQSKRYKAMDSQNVSAESSHLEKNFFFSRRFDEKTFILFMNTCSEKLKKYGAYYKEIKEDINEAKEYMISNTKLNSDEAKYIFFWGLDVIFEEDKERIKKYKEEELKNKNMEV